MNAAFSVHPDLSHPPVPVPPAKGLRRDSLISGIGSVGATGLAGIASLAITRALTVSARGHWAVISSLAVLIGAIWTLGVPAAAAYAAGRTTGRERAQVIRAMLMICIPLSLAALGSYAGIALVVRPAGVALPLLLTGGPIAAASVWQHVAQQLTLTTLRLEWFAAAQLVPGAAILIAILAICVLGSLSVLDVVAASTAAVLVGFATSFSGLYRGGLITKRVVPVRRAIALVRPYLAFAALTFGVTALTQVTQRIDVLIVSGLRGSRAAALYAVGGQVSELILVVPVALGYVVFRRGSTGATGH